MGIVLVFGFIERCLPTFDKTPCTYPLSHSFKMDSYDYIIVGGGTAGLVVASRLSQDDGNISVLVVEAGRDHVDDPFVDTPGFLSQLLGNEQYDWNFTSTPQVS